MSAPPVLRPAHPTTTPAEPPTPGRALLPITLVLSLLLAVSSVAALAAGLMMAARGGAAAAPWFTLGFEAIVLMSAVFGVLTGLGRFESGRSMALVCVAGAVFASSLLGYRASQGQLGGVPLWWALLFRLALAAGLGVIAGALVWRGSPGRGLRMLGAGLALLAPSTLVIGSILMGYAAGPLAGLGGTGRSTVYGLGLLVGGIGLAIGAHLVIRAFESAIEQHESYSASPPPLPSAQTTSATISANPPVPS